MTLMCISLNDVNAPLWGDVNRGANPSCVQQDDQTHETYVLDDLVGISSCATTRDGHLKRFGNGGA